MRKIKLLEMLQKEGMNHTLEFLMGIHDRKLKDAFEKQIHDLYRQAGEMKDGQQRQKVWREVKLFIDSYQHETNGRYRG